MGFYQQTPASGSCGWAQGHPAPLWKYESSGESPHRVGLSATVRLLRGVGRNAEMLSSKCKVLLVCYKQVVNEYLWGKLRYFLKYNFGWFPNLSYLII